MTMLPPCWCGKSIEQFPPPPRIIDYIVDCPGERYCYIENYPGGRVTT